MDRDHDASSITIDTREYAAANESHAVKIEVTDVDAFLRELRKSKRELEIARHQFETVTDPMLIDHVVFRLGAAERHFNYLFQIARRNQVAVDGMRWEWYEED